MYIVDINIKWSAVQLCQKYATLIFESKTVASTSVL